MKSFSIVALSLSLYPIISAASTSTETDSFPTYSNHTQDVNPDDLSTESTLVWTDVTVGMMMYQSEADKYIVDYDEDQENEREKRGSVKLELGSDGSWELAKRSDELRKVKRGSMTNGQATWYSDGDLKNPGCWNKSRWQPGNNSKVCAFQESSKFAKCGQFVKLCNGKKCTVCRKWDFCASCNSKHVDLGPAAFKELGPLDEGVINKLTISTTSQPFPNSQWKKYMTQYGPQNQ